MAVSVGELFLKLVVETKEGTANLRKLGGQVEQTVQDSRRAFVRFGRDIGQSFEQLKANWLQITAAVGGGAALFSRSIAEFSGFDQRIAEITTLLDDMSEESIKQLGDEVLALSVKFGQSVEDMAKARYDAISAGFTGTAESAELLANAARLAVGGVSEISRTTDVLTSVLNAYGLSAAYSGKVSDILFTTVRLGKTTIDALASSFGVVTAVAPAVGVSIEEVAAATATLTARGLSTEETITALQATLTALLKPSEDMKEALLKMGFNTGAAAVRSLGFTEVLKKLTQGLNEAEIAARFPNVRAMRSVFPLAGNAATAFAGNLKQIRQATGATDVAFGKMSERISFRLNQMQTRLTKAAITIGSALLPVAEAIATLVAWFGRLPPIIQQVIVIGGVLTTTVLALIPAINALSIAIKGLIANVPVLGWIAIGVSALIGAVSLYQVATMDAEKVTEDFKKSLKDFPSPEAQLQKLGEQMAAVPLMSEAAAAKTLKAEQRAKELRILNLKDEFKRREALIKFQVAREAAQFQEFPKVQQQLALRQQQLLSKLKENFETQRKQQEAQALSAASERQEAAVRIRIRALESEAERRRQLLEIQYRQEQDAWKDNSEVLMALARWRSQELEKIGREEAARQQERLRRQQAAEEAHYQQILDRLRLISAPISQGWDNLWRRILDTNMTGRQKLQAIWQGMQQRFVQTIGAMLKAEISARIKSLLMHKTAESTKTAVTRKQVAQRLGALLAGMAKEIAATAKSIGLFLAKTVAKLAAWFAGMGPLGIAAGLAAIPALIAGVKALIKGAAGFSIGGLAGGGIATRPLLAAFAEAGSPEAAIPLNEQGAEFMARLLPKMVLAAPAPDVDPEALLSRMERMVLAVEQLKIEVTSTIDGVSFVKQHLTEARKQLQQNRFG